MVRWTVSHKEMPCCLTTVLQESYTVQDAPPPSLTISYFHVLLKWRFPIIPYRFLVFHSCIPFLARGCKLCTGFLSLFIVHRLGSWSTYVWISLEYLQIFLGTSDTAPRNIWRYSPVDTRYLRSTGAISDTNHRDWHNMS